VIIPSSSSFKEEVSATDSEARGSVEIAACLGNWVGAVRMRAITCLAGRPERIARRGDADSLADRFSHEASSAGGSAPDQCSGVCGSRSSLAQAAVGPCNLWKVGTGRDPSSALSIGDLLGLLDHRALAGSDPT
jgi:hypothetical protein